MKIRVVFKTAVTVGKCLEPRRRPSIFTRALYLSGQRPSRPRLHLHRLVTYPATTDADISQTAELCFLWAVSVEQSATSLVWLVCHWTPSSRSWNSSVRTMTNIASAAVTFFCDFWHCNVIVLTDWLTDWLTYSLCLSADWVFAHSFVVFAMWYEYMNIKLLNTNRMTPSKRRTKV